MSRCPTDERARGAAGFGGPDEGAEVSRILHVHGDQHETFGMAIDRCGIDRRPMGNGNDTGRSTDRTHGSERHISHGVDQ